MGGWVIDKLTEDGGLYPCWSPDGSLIVYCASSYTSVMDLYSVPMDGGEPTQLTNISGVELYPSWSQETSDKEIIFVNTSFISGAQTEGQSRIYTGSFATRDLNIALESDSILACPTFSYDRTYIVYINDSANRGIWTIEVDNPQAVPLMIPNSSGWGEVLFARASHSDDRVIYVEKKDNCYNINSIKLSGGEPTQITNNPAGSTIFIHSADISYDGSMIVYDVSSSPASSESRLYLISVSGGEAPPLTRTTDGIFHSPSWAPDNKRIAVNRKVGPSGSGNVYVIELDI